MPWGKRKPTFDEKKIDFTSEMTRRAYDYARKIGIVLGVYSIPNEPDSLLFKFSPTTEDKLQDILGPQLKQPDLNLPTPQKVVLKESKPRVRRTRAEIEAAKEKKPVVPEVKA